MGMGETWGLLLVKQDSGRSTVIDGDSNVSAEFLLEEGMALPAGEGVAVDAERMGDGVGGKAVD